MILLALTIFVSAFLLFLVQPVIAKQILPWFGGGAAVWSTCLVFFQVALLAGYFYSDWIVRKLPAKRQLLLHSALVATALVLLPIVPDVAWKPAGDEQPSVRILLLLSATIGLPYFLLATTSPLVQAWFARAHPGKSPYRLFALSNLASMLALLSYPFAVEPLLTTRQQALSWSAGFGMFAALILAAMWKLGRIDAHANKLESTAADTAFAPVLSDKLTWIAFAALGSSLLLGVSNHITHNIASVPLLWVAPLALYLLTFILCFNARDGAIRWYRRAVFMPLAALAICAMAWLLADRRFDFKLTIQVAVFCSGLFATCMYCHGELAARKPSPHYLTLYYLMISLGGALGALLVGIVAPLTLPAYYELGFALYAVAALATWLLWQRAHWGWIALGAAVCLFTLASSLYTMHDYRRDAIELSRNFYGAVRVQEAGIAGDADYKRWLVHGAILHGDQYQSDFRRYAATTYYTPTSGVGLVLLQKRRESVEPRRVGIIGLGAGTLATYGFKDDVYRFYEIDPQVIEIARRHFTYLQDSYATIEIALGDARLNLEREPPQRFDVLAVDAFTSDAIPVHLITLEALAVYEKHMKADGVIAFHVSNRFLQLQPVLKQLADAQDLSIAWIKEKDADTATVSDWVLLSKDASVLQTPELLAVTLDIQPKANLRLWTDDFNNLAQVLK